ncbi:helix-turn-helix transcriptional regulator [Pseudogemmobacter humi]|uniref:HTH luxR-type domain-containing protein n=1 Tax=Pseudogemmobacter humi TaxID=2483812 RepID=A0A3P5XF42_9RHOB|nr:hypothetical protein [Pseudogemmobacter humi]VDC33431.1 hypothetical protein XINFAN_03826 [Pseudogemmobacter humi]
MKSVSPDSAEELIDLIYEAAVLPEFWPAALDKLATLSQSLGSILIARSTDGLKMTASTPMFMQEATEYFLTFSAQNERLRRLIALGRSGFVADSDVFSQEEIVKEPMFSDYLIPRGLGQGIATVIPMPTGDEIILHCEGRFQGAPTAPALIARMDLLRPHIARAALVASRIAFEKARTAVETLSRVGIPAAAVSLSGELLLTNPGFEAESQVWTTRFRDRLALQDGVAQALLVEALRATRHGTSVRSIPITKTGGPAILHVLPVCRDARDLFSRAAAILVLTRATDRSGPPDSLLQALFDLTPSEAVIAKKLSLGLSANQIAAESGRSLETIRNQIKRVLSKSGHSRQSDLLVTLAVLTKGTPPPPGT